MQRRSSIRDLLTSPGATVVPGVVDSVVANLAVAAGFETVYVSGNMLASSMGVPDIGLVTMRDVVARAGEIARAVDVPVICDADTGYGNAVNVFHTVETFERVGVEAIHLEDQVTPKRCGHEAGKQLEDLATMVSKVRAAISARSTSRFVVIARTDARGVSGIDETLRRCEAYANAGADMIFPESLQSEEEFECVASELPGIPLVANMTDFGRTPLITAERFAELGYTMVLYPGAISRSMWWAARESLNSLRRLGTQGPWRDRMLDRQEMDALTGAPVWAQRESQIAEWADEATRSFLT